MATTKTNMTNKLRERSFKRELAKHIPDLWKYAKILSNNEDRAYSLLSETLKKAMIGWDTEHQKDASYLSLSRLMYRQFLESYDRNPQIAQFAMAKQAYEMRSQY